MKIPRGTTGKKIRIFVGDSTSTRGAGLTGLTSVTSDLTCYYLRDGNATATAVPLMAGTLGTWTNSGSNYGFIAVANMAGMYEFSCPNAMFAAGESVELMFDGAANMIPTPLRIELIAVNEQSQTAFITAINGLAPPANWNNDIIQTGDAYARLGVAGVGLTNLGDTRLARLSSTISSHTAADVWAVGTRTLTGFGTLVSDVATAVWGATSRTLSAFGFTVAPTAAQVRAEMDANSTKLDVAVSSRSSHSAYDVWLVSLGASFLPNTLGLKLKNWVLGSDNKVMISNDAGAVPETAEAGTGPRSYTFTVTRSDNDAPIEGAKVRIAKLDGSDVCTGRTDASGQVTLFPHDYTYNCTVSSPYYDTESFQIVVTGDGSREVGLDLRVFPDIAGPDEVTIRYAAYAFSYSGEGATITYRVVAPTGGDRDNQIYPVGDELPVLYEIEGTITNGICDLALPVGLTMRCYTRYRGKTTFTNEFEVPNANANLKDILFPG